jgi:prephenate dehydrogenase
MILHPRSRPGPESSARLGAVRVTILGFGLIGGSLARALARRRPDWPLTAWSRDQADPRRALGEGVLAAVAADAEGALRDADLVVLAASPLGNLELLDLAAPLLAGGPATLTDVSSSKGAIAARAARHPGLRFVGGHPMSGRERRGYAASTAELFEGRPWVICPAPAATPEDVARVRDLATACGARPLEVDATRHDQAVAVVSHLPLLASAALVESAAHDEGWSLAAQLAAQGWRDMSRLARGDASLGAGIVATNAAAIGGALRRYRQALDEWQALVDEAAGTDEAAPASAPAIERRLADTATLAAETA